MMISGPSSEDLSHAVRLAHTPSFLPVYPETSFTCSEEDLLVQDLVTVVDPEENDLRASSPSSPKPDVTPEPQASMKPTPPPSPSQFTASSWDDMIWSNSVEGCHSSPSSVNWIDSKALSETQQSGSMLLVRQLGAVAIQNTAPDTTVGDCGAKIDTTSTSSILLSSLDRNPISLIAPVALQRYTGSPAPLSVQARCTPDLPINASIIVPSSARTTRPEISPDQQTLSSPVSQATEAHEASNEVLDAVRELKALVDSALGKGDIGRNVAPETQAAPNREMPKQSHTTKIRRASNFVIDIVGEMFAFVGAIIVDTLHFMFMIVKKPLTLCLVLYILFCFVSHVTPLALDALLHHICTIPVITFLGFKQCHFRLHSPPSIPSYSKVFQLQNDYLKKIMETSLRSSPEGEMVLAAIATTDLKVLIKHSTLAHKDELVDHLERFVVLARNASLSLPKLSIMVIGSVTRIVAFNKYLIRELTISDPPSSALLQRLGELMQFLRPGSPAPSKHMISLFKQASESVEKQIIRLIAQAQAVHFTLVEMGELLDYVQDIAQTEDNMLRKKTEEVLAELWTKLGGNRRTLAKFESHHKLLRNVDRSRRDTLSRVSTTLTELLKLNGELQYLTENMPDSNEPLEVQLDFMREATRRLHESKDQREKEYLAQRMMFDIELGVVRESRVQVQRA